MGKKKKKIKSTHLSDIFPRATEIHKRYIDEIRAVTHRYSLLLERILGPHSNNLSQFKILHKNKTRNINGNSWADML